jgi:hypothetical protein
MGHLVVLVIVLAAVWVAFRLFRAAKHLQDR